MYGTIKSFVKYKNMHSILVLNREIQQVAYCVYFFLNDRLNNINRNILGIVNIDDMQVFLLLFADDAVVFTYDPKS
jgi:hypothetical protein